MNAGGGGDVIKVNTGRSSIQLDRTLKTSVVEKVHLEVLNKVARRVRGGTMETEGTWDTIINK